MGFFDRHYQSYDEWCETPRGKAFNEKMRLAAEENARKKEEWERNIPPEKKEQVKLFKIIIVPLFLSFAVSDWWGMKHFKFPYVFGIQLLIALIGFILFKKNPFKVKYPNCFFMAPVALFMSFMFSFYLCISEFGLKQAVLIKPPVEVIETSGDASEKLSETPDLAYLESSEIDISELDFYSREYSQWLIENNRETSEELVSDYKKLKDENGR